MNSLGTSALFLVACALSALDALGQTALDSPASETPTQDYPRAASAASLNAAPSGTSEIPQSDQSSASNSTPRVARSDRNLHDGFYLRLALGGGSTSWTRGKHHDEETAPAGLYDVALGGTIGPGVVLGGGLFNTVADLDGLYRLTVLAPFVDYYFNPHEGLHMQFALGAAVEESDTVSYGVERDTGGGVGGFVAVGHEWWTSASWSAGLMLRAQFVKTKNPSTSGLEAQNLSLGILGTITYQ